MSPPMNPAPPRPVVGRKLRFLLETHHTTVSELASIVDVRRETIQDLVDGTADARASTLQSIARYFEVGDEYFDGAKAEGEAAPTSEADLMRKGARNSSGNARNATRPAAPAKSAEALSLKTLAVRYQGLIELMLEKGVVTPAELNEKMREVDARAKKRG
ncbi:MAG: helix-turn-helix transcriptional regulator [Planctomycetota bacterium]